MRNPRALQLSFETYRKRGRGWEYLGLRHISKDDPDPSRKAARETSYVHHIKVVGIRPEDSRDKLWVYRFNYPMSLTSS